MVAGDGLVDELVGEGASEERIHEDEGRPEDEVVHLSSDEEQEDHQQLLVLAASSDGLKSVFDWLIHQIFANNILKTVMVGSHSLSQ